MDPSRSPSVAPGEFISADFADNSYQSEEEELEDEEDEEDGSSVEAEEEDEEEAEHGAIAHHAEHEHEHGHATADNEEVPAYTSDHAGPVEVGPNGYAVSTRPLSYGQR